MWIVAVGKLEGGDVCLRLGVLYLPVCTRGRAYIVVGPDHTREICNNNKTNNRALRMEDDKPISKRVWERVGYRHRDPVDVRREDLPEFFTENTNDDAAADDDEAECPSTGCVLGASCTSSPECAEGLACTDGACASPTPAPARPSVSTFWKAVVDWATDLVSGPRRWIVYTVLAGVLLILLGVLLFAILSKYGGGSGSGSGDGGGDHVATVFSAPNAALPIAISSTDVSSKEITSDWPAPQAAPAPPPLPQVVALNPSPLPPASPTPLMLPIAPPMSAV